jgi:hypothetical protein
MRKEEMTGLALWSLSVWWGNREREREKAWERRAYKASVLKMVVNRWIYGSEAQREGGA